MKLTNEEKCVYCREYGNLPCDECNKKLEAKKLFDDAKEENETYSFSYLSCGKTLTVHIEAKNLNEAMIKFATNYHDIEWLYHAKIL